MPSECLNHPGRVASHRCVSCLKPLCQDCTQSYAEGIFCSNQCHENAKLTEERAAILAKSDEDLKAWQKRQNLIKVAVWAVIIGLIYGLWDKLPTVIT